MSEQIKYAYLAEGRLFVAESDGEPQPIESQFVQAIEDRRAADRERNQWKSSGMMWNLSQSPEFEIPNLNAAVGGGRSVRFTGVTGGEKSGEIYYALVNESVGGLFHLDTTEDYERRLVHRREMMLRDLARCPGDGRLACSLKRADGSANLALAEADGGRLREITTGDSVDEAPTWVAGSDAKLVFQSAGVGRNEYGAVFGLGPYAIHELDLARDKMSTILDHEGFDCLTPRVDTDGCLYFIRRPYELRPKTSPLKLLSDVALFPFRLVRAGVHFLNAFSLFFSKKPLMTAGGPPREGPDRRMLMLWGRWVEVERQLRRGQEGSDKPLVPQTWQLIRRTPEGDEETLATSVVAFDLADDGALVYSNGRAIYHRDGEGRTETISRDFCIERLCVLA